MMRLSAYIDGKELHGEKLRAKRIVFSLSNNGRLIPCVVDGEGNIDKINTVTYSIHYIYSPEEDKGYQPHYFSDRLEVTPLTLRR